MSQLLVWAILFMGLFHILISPPPVRICNFQILLQTLGFLCNSTHLLVMFILLQFPGSFILILPKVFSSTKQDGHLVQQLSLSLSHKETQGVKVAKAVEI